MAPARRRRPIAAHRGPSRRIAAHRGASRRIEIRTFNSNAGPLDPPASRLAQGDPTLPCTTQSATHVVLATLKRSESELSSYQRKVFKVDDHMGMAIAGLTSDGRVLCRYMRDECLNYRWAQDCGRGHARKGRGGLRA
jgi:hypothetical protein